MTIMTMEESNNPTSRFGVCQICEEKDGKYRCPRCEVVSCSLTCVTTHKEKDSCDGVRNKSKFIPLSRFTELDVISDYRLLESANRCVESYARDKLKRVTQINPYSGRLELPKHLMVFRNACFRRGECRVRFLPPHFQRRKNNCSKLDWKKNLITWKVVINFVHSRCKIDKVVPETSLLYDILRPFVEVSAPAAEADDQVMSDEDAAADEQANEANPYLVYQAAGFGRLDIKLKAEGGENDSQHAEGGGKKQRRYYDLRLDKSLRENLEGKSLIEHPVIIVSLQSHRDYFDNMSDEEEDEEEAEVVVKEVIEEEEMNEGPGSWPDHQQVNQEPDVSKPPPPVAKTEAEAQVYKNCFDYYLNYYNEKYGVQQTPPQVPQKKRTASDVVVVAAAGENRPQEPTAAVTSEPMEEDGDDQVSVAQAGTAAAAAPTEDSLLSGLVAYSESDSE